MTELSSKQTQLDTLAAQIEQDNITPQLRESAIQLVMGGGNPDADIVLIGEAPGKQEDERGLPFVGASGKFLDEMFASAGLEREDIYITNIVKYRPPNNRDPLPEEKTLFWPYLQRQLKIIDPKVIITLGRHSGSIFIPSMRISEDHGRVFRVNLDTDEYTLIPLYHPAAALYNGSMRQVLIDDFIAAATLVKTLYWAVEGPAGLQNHA